ncbi:hypothetical protein D9M68_648230 [compost metagenome]
MFSLQYGGKELLPRLSEPSNLVRDWPLERRSGSRGNTRSADRKSQAVKAFGVFKKRPLQVRQKAGHQDVRLTLLAQSNLQGLAAGCGLATAFHPAAAGHSNGSRITILSHSRKTCTQQRMHQARLARDGTLWWFDLDLVVSDNVKEVTFVGAGVRLRCISVEPDGIALSVRERNAITVLGLCIHPHVVPAFLPVDLANRRESNRTGVGSLGPSGFTPTQASRPVVTRHNLSHKP